MPLPDFYTDWLATLDEEDALLFGGSDYYLLSAEELGEEVVVDKSTSPAYGQLSLYLKTFAEVTGLNEFVADTGDVFPTERIKSCITIGEHNGDLLFVDLSDDLSLWLYHVDGADIERVRGDLADFVRLAAAE